MIAAPARRRGAGRLRAAGTLVAALLAARPARAYSPAGYGVPEVGGPLAGLAERGPLGLAYGPGAAAPPYRGGSASLGLDVGWLYNALRYRLDAYDGQGEASRGVAAVPWLGATAGRGRVGLGFTVLAPLARGGGGGDPEGLARFYGIEGKLLVLEEDACLGAVPGGPWRLGLALRTAQMRVSSTKAVDTGALVHAMAGDVAADLVGDPFLEGTQELEGHRGHGFGWAFSAHFEPERGPALHLALRSPIRVVLRGPVDLVPSNDLALELAGRVRTPMTLPAEVYLSGVVPLGERRLVLDLAWTGWSSLRSYESDVSDLRVLSDDPLMAGLLDDYGITEAEFLDEVSGATTVTGMRDTWWGGGSAVLPVGERGELRPGLWGSTAAVPDELAHPSNLDFAALDLRLAGAWRPRWWVDLGGGLDVFWSPTRRVTDSLHDLADPTPPGTTIPSGNGVYHLFMARAGLSLVVRR